MVLTRTLKERLHRLRGYQKTLMEYKETEREYITNSQLSVDSNVSEKIVLEDLDSVDAWTSNTTIHQVSYLIIKIGGYMNQNSLEEVFLIGAQSEDLNSMLEKIQLQLMVNVVCVFYEDNELVNFTTIKNKKAFPINKIAEMGRRMNINKVVLQSSPIKAQCLSEQFLESTFSVIYNYTGEELILKDTIKVINCRFI
ncbi:MAG: hypothetical protein ACEPOV_12125 [Hyphomicrobiales bacterium]